MCRQSTLRISIGKKYLRNELDLPEVAEIDLVRHYTNLSRRNFGVDLGFYPLGSCTMKYNPKVNENVAALPALPVLHPYATDEFAQGNLQLIYEMQKYLCGFSVWRNLHCSPRQVRTASLPAS